MDAETGRLCMAMYFIPQINIVDMESGRAVGFKLAEKTKSALRRGVRHYHDVTSAGDRIYALYFGEKEENIFAGRSSTELHVFDWSGRFIARYLFEDIVNGCKASEDGLYVTTYAEDGLRLNFVSWEQIH